MDDIVITATFLLALIGLREATWVEYGRRKCEVRRPMWVKRGQSGEFALGQAHDDHLCRL